MQSLIVRILFMSLIPLTFAQANCRKINGGFRDSNGSLVYVIRQDNCRLAILKSWDNLEETIILDNVERLLPSERRGPGGSIPLESFRSYVSHDGFTLAYSQRKDTYSLKGNVLTVDRPYYRHRANLFLDSSVSLPRFSQARPRCQNFSGSYEGHDPQFGLQTVNLTQNSCDLLTIDADGVTFQLRFDGTVRVISLSSLQGLSGYALRIPNGFLQKRMLYFFEAQPGAQDYIDDRFEFSDDGTTLKRTISTKDLVFWGMSNVKTITYQKK